MNSYQSWKIVLGKAVIVAAATLMPPWMLLSAGQDAAVMHTLERRLEDTKHKDTLEPGDLVWVSGAVQATPLDLPQSMSELTQSLRIEERVEQRHRSGKHSSWRTVRSNEWITARAILGVWRLDLDLIRKTFPSDFASPCTQYHPHSAAWETSCPGARYAYDRGDSKRRMSIKATPVPAGRVSLLATVSPTGDSLTLITANDTYHKPFAILGLGHQESQAMIESRLTEDWIWMAFWWALVFLVASLWMRAALRGSQLLTTGELFSGSYWRALVTTAPLLALFLVFNTAFFLPVAGAAATVAAVLGFCLWFLAGNSR